MRTVLTAACLALALNLAAGCAGESKYNAVLLANRELAKAAAVAEAAPPGNAERRPAGPATPAADPVAAIEPRMVVYTGSFALLVADVAAAVDAARKLGESLGGYVQQATLTSIVLRVPAAKFNPAVEALADLGAVTDKQIDAQDVTEEYADLDLRLKSNKALLEKLLALLAKAENVKDALEVEREAARVRAEIEKLEGQKNRLAGRIAYATLSIRFTPAREAPRELRTTLPFPWLKQLGLDRLMAAFGV